MLTNKKTRLIDIAKYLSVSNSTVSRALNGNHDISDDTRQKVLQAVNDLNYTPNDNARDLVKQTSNTIAAIIPNILNPYYAEIITSIEKVLRRNHCTLILCITNESDVQVDYCLTEMLKKRVSGIILLSTVVKNRALLEKIKRNTIVVGVSTNHEGIDQIVNTDEKATYSIIKHLLELGHQRIGFIGYNTSINSVLKNRLTGYKKALEEFDIKYDESLVIDGGATGNPGYKSAKMLLQMPSRPTAIHCINEYLAMGAYSAICDLRIKIPDEISLTGHDGLEMSGLIRPPLTTIKIPISEMGEAAAEFILQRRYFGIKKEQQMLLFDSKISIGGTTAPPPEYLQRN